MINCYLVDIKSFPSLFDNPPKDFYGFTTLEVQKLTIDQVSKTESIQK